MLKRDVKLHLTYSYVSVFMCVFVCMLYVTMAVLMMMYDVVVPDQETAWREELVSILSSVPQSVLVVMRYLFAFLNQ